jgi:cytochrome P450
VGLFTVKDNEHHAQLKRPVARAYAMTTLLEYEPFVDTTTILFMKRIDELYVGRGQSCDFGKWLQYYAFDVIGEMTFSKRFGFLERNEDVDGIIQSLHDTRWLITIAQMPWLDQWIRKNSLLMRLTKFSSPAVMFTAARIRERIGWPGPALTPDEKLKLPPMQPRGQEDFLSRFLNARTTHSDVVDNMRVLSYAQGNMTAGSDTTAITLRAIFHHLLKRPSAMERL